MAFNKRQAVQAQAAVNKAEAVRLFLAGVTNHSEIGRRLGVTPTTVGRYLQQADDEWRQKSFESVDKAKWRQLRDLEWIRNEAKAAWERSKLDAEATKVSVGDEGGGKKVERVTKGQTGDPRYLAEIRATYEREAKLLGIDAPTKVAPTTPDGKKPYSLAVDVVQALSDEELALMVEAARLQERLESSIEAESRPVDGE